MNTVYLYVYTDRYICLLKDILIQVLFPSFYNVIKLLFSYLKSEVQATGKLELPSLCPVDFGILCFPSHSWWMLTLHFFIVPETGSLSAAQGGSDPSFSPLSLPSAETPGEFHHAWHRRELQMPALSFQNTAGE